MESKVTAECTWLNETYDKYAAILFSVLIDLCGSEPDAEAVLARTFERLHTEQYFLRGRFIGLVAIVKLTVDTAKNYVSFNGSPCVKTFQQSPMLHSLLFDNVSIESVCQHSGLTKLEIARQIRTELARVQEVPLSNQTQEKTGLHSFPNRR